MEKLNLKYGLSTGHGVLRSPNSISVYAALACIAIQSNQNDQHGGQAIPNFDYGMAPGVAKSYIKHFYHSLFLPQTRLHQVHQFLSPYVDQSYNT